MAHINKAGAAQPCSPMLSLFQCMEEVKGRLQVGIWIRRWQSYKNEGELLFPLLCWLSKQLFRC